MAVGGLLRAHDLDAAFLEEPALLFRDGVRDHRVDLVRPGELHEGFPAELVTIPLFFSSEDREAIL